MSKFLGDTAEALRLPLFGRIITYPGRRILRLATHPWSGGTRGDGAMAGSSRLLEGNRLKSYKLVLIGDSGAGKSSLLHRWINDRWLGEHGGNISTIGAAFCQANLDFEDGTKQKIDIWDTAGQERYRGMLALYYRNSDLGLLVCDLTEPAEIIRDRIGSWIAEYRERAGNQHLILVGNKVDLLRDQPSIDSYPSVLALREVAEKHELPVVLTSALTGQGVDALVSLISQKVWTRLDRVRKEVLRASEGGKSLEELDEEYFFGDASAESSAASSASRCSLL